MAQQQQLKIDDLAEDVFGLNIRALRTISDIVIRPARVFVAARDPDWELRYTPSIRLVFSILAVLAFFSFIWAGEDSSFAADFARGFADALQIEDPQAEEEIALRILAFYAASLPFSFIIAHGLMSQFARVWGPEARAVARLRFYMIAIAPGMLLTAVSSMLLPAVGKLPGLTADVYSASVILGVFTLDALTSFRGGVAGRSRLSRMAKSLALACCALLASILANIASANIPLVVFATGRG